MLIICPKCFAKYEVDEHLLHDNVQIFQCTECQHRFEEHLELSTKNLPENTLNMPTSFPSVVSDAVQNATQNNETIPSSKDFIVERHAVLPEAFTPIENMPKQKGRKVLLLVFILLFILMVFGGMYLWMIKDVVLEQYPSVRKAVSLLNAKPVHSVSVEAELPMEEDGIGMGQSDSANMQKVSVNEVIDLTKQEVVQMPERILPVETEAIEMPISNEVKAPTNETDMSEDIVELVEVPAENVLNNPDNIGQTVQNPSEDNILPVNQNLQESPVVSVSKTVNPDKVVKSADDSLVNEKTEVIEDILMPADISGEVVAVQIKDVTFKNDTTDKTLSRMFVQGMVENTSGVVGVIPPLQAQLYDKDNVLLGVRDLPYAPTMIQPKSPEFFFYELSEVPTGSVAKVTVIVKGQ